MKWSYGYHATVVCALLFLGGCVTTSGPQKVAVADPVKAEFLADKPAALRPICTQLLEEGDRNKSLNLMKMGLNAMQLGDKSDATWAFDATLADIEKVYANSEQATKARSLWVEEGCKNFKGEPYERALAYYYRGLLYIDGQDLQNARASFKGGMLQDAFAEEEQHRCDIALFSYLGGWCSQRIADDTLAAGYFEELHKLRPDAPLPDAADNVLLVVETGNSPRKVADGVGHYQLKFRRGKDFTEKKAGFKIDDGAITSLDLSEDIVHQATSRGGREFDYLLQGKAAFKRETAAVGAALGDVAQTSMVAASLSGNYASEVQGVSAGIGLISVVSQIAAARARTEADTRYWNNLADCVHVASFKLTPGRHTLTILYMDERGAEIPALQQGINLEIAPQGYKLIWLRSREQLTL